MLTVRSIRARGRALLAEVVLVGLGLAAIFTAAIWLSRPMVDIRVDSADQQRYLLGFYDTEGLDGSAFRWSRTDATVRLYGFDQRAPVLVRARIGAGREPGQPPVQLTLGPEAPLTVALAPAWRSYALLVAPPPHDREGRLLALHSLVDPPYPDQRALGFALGRIQAIAAPRDWSERLPDPARLAFLTLLGLLLYMRLRSLRVARPLALAATFGLALALGAALAAAPVAVGYWLPQLWLALSLGWLALLLPPLLRVARRAVGAGPSRPWLLGGLLAIGCAQALLPQRQPWSGALGWPLLVAGALLAVAWLPARPPEERSPLSRPLVALALGAVAALALALRLAWLSDLPLGMWRDEARHGLLALHILNDPSFRPIYSAEADIPALLFYLAAAPIGLFGPQVGAVRLVPALAGALTPLALYYMARPLFGARVALFAAALLACSSWHLSLSRLAFAATLGPPLALLAIGSLWRTLRPGPAFHRLLAALLTGGATGLALYTYHPSRLTPLVVGLMTLVLLGSNPRAWRLAAPYLALAAAIVLALALPLARYAADQAGNFNERVEQTSIFSPDTLAGRAPLARLEESLRANLGIWNEHGDDNARHNLSGAPELDPLSGALFAIGVGLALAWWRERRARLLLVWLAVALIPGIFSGGAPHAVRTVEVIAPSLLLAAIAGDTLLGALPGVGAWLRRERARLALAAAVGVAALAINAARYFVLWPASPGAYREFYVADTHMGEVARALARMPDLEAAGYRVFVQIRSGTDDVVSYLIGDTGVGTYDGRSLSAPPGARALLIAKASSQIDTDERARQLLGANARRLGVGPSSPTSGRPEFVVYGDGELAARAVDLVLAQWRR